MLYNFPCKEKVIHLLCRRFSLTNYFQVFFRNQLRIQTLDKQSPQYSLRFSCFFIFVSDFLQLQQTDILFLSQDVKSFLRIRRSNYYFQKHLCHFRSCCSVNLLIRSHNPAKNRNRIGFICFFISFQKSISTTNTTGICMLGCHNGRFVKFL